MTAIREQVLAAVASRLAAIPGYNFKRNPVHELASTDVPALVMLDGGQAEPTMVTGAVQYTLNLTVEVFVTGEDIGPALNAGYVAVLDALLADRTLGGLAQDLRELAMTDPEILSEDGHRPFAAVAVEFAVAFWTSESSPELLAP